MCIFVPIKRKIKTRSSIGGEQQKLKIMNERTHEIASLRYQIQRYRSVGNGAMCQKLSAKLRALTGTAVVA